MNKKLKTLISVIMLLEISSAFTGCGTHVNPADKITVTTSNSSDSSVDADNIAPASKVQTEDNASKPSPALSSSSSNNSAPQSSTVAATVTSKEQSGTLKDQGETSVDKTVTSSTPASNQETSKETKPDTAGKEATPDTTGKPPLVTPKPTQETILNITEKESKSFSAVLNSDIKYPVVSGMQDAAIQASINALLENDAVSFKSQIEQSAQEGFEDSKKNSYPFRQYAADTTYKTDYNKNGILSITVMYYQFTGGAHGMDAEKAYNFDLKTGKMLKLSELFPKDFNYKDIMNAKILSDMKADPDKYFADSIQAFKGIDENHHYYIEEGNVVIYYDRYEIAPYVSGIPEFKIPFSNLVFSSTLNIK